MENDEQSEVQNGVGNVTLVYRTSQWRRRHCVEVDMSLLRSARCTGHTCSHTLVCVNSHHPLVVVVAVLFCYRVEQVDD